MFCLLTQAYNQSAHNKNKTLERYKPSMWVVWKKKISAIHSIFEKQVLF